MTMHFNIGEAKAKLSKIVAAVLRGEDIVLDKAGVPKVRLVPFDDASKAEREEMGRRRRANFGIYRDKYAGVDLTVPPSMTDEELEERYRRKFGPAD